MKINIKFKRCMFLRITVNALKRIFFKSLRIEKHDVVKLTTKFPYKSFNRMRSFCHTLNPVSCILCFCHGGLCFLKESCTRENLDVLKIKTFDL